MTAADQPPAVCSCCGAAEGGDPTGGEVDRASGLCRVVEAVRALCEQARKVSPSPAMNLYLGDIEQALGLRTDGTRGIVGQRETA